MISDLLVGAAAVKFPDNTIFSAMQRGKLRLRNGMSYLVKMHFDLLQKLYLHSNDFTL